MLNEKIEMFSKNHQYHTELKEFIEETHKILLSADAKRVRGCIPALIGETQSLKLETGLLYGLVIELLHFTSLIHDDVIDDHMLRRGLPTLNNMFTKRHGVLIGDYLMCEIVNYSLRFKNRAEIIKMVFDAVKDLVNGLLFEQGRISASPDLSWYQKVVHCKTSSLFRLSFGIPFVSGPGLPDALMVGNHFGFLYQIYDDYFDQQEDESFKNIFCLLPKSEITAIIDEYYSKLMICGRRIGIENSLNDIVDYLRNFGYFCEI